MQYLIALTNLFAARRDERGATAVEYGLLVVLIAAGIVAIVATLGTQIAEGFTTVSTNLGGGGEEAGD
ncbi:Flp family type IVb pilin [Nocardioides panacisoli]|nr:Flp family type IVb pilin [Nocardioides panacisoli]